MSRIQNIKHTSGFSIIELLVSVTVGLILIAGISSVYLASKQSYVEVERMSRVTQNSRFALQMITETLQHAGFTGEVPLGNITLDTDLDSPPGDCDGIAAVYDINNYLIAATTDSSGTAFGCVTDAVATSSAILVKNVRPMRMVDADPDNSADTPDGVISFPTGIQSGNTYIISNNSRGIIFDGADSASIPSIDEGGDIPDGSAWEYEAQIYYIRNVAGTPTLSRRVLTGSAGFTTEDLIGGVEAMSFLFGLDTNSDGEIDTYRTIANMLNTEWVQVAAVEVDVLVRSETEDPNHTDNEVYNLGGIGAIGPIQDNYHRLVMQSTVSLRNPKFVLRGNL